MKRIALVVVLAIVVMFAVIAPAVGASTTDINTYATSCKAINPNAIVVNVGRKFSNNTAQLKICLLKTSKYNVVLGAKVHSTVKTKKRYDIHGKFLTPVYKVDGLGASYLALNTPANRWVINHRYFKLVGYRPSKVSMGLVIRYPSGTIYALSARTRWLS